MDHREGTKWARWGILLLLAGAGCGAPSDPGTAPSGASDPRAPGDVGTPNGASSTAASRTNAGDYRLPRRGENTDAGTGPATCTNDGVAGTPCGSLCCGPTDEMECVDEQCQPICDHAQALCDGVCCPEGSVCENGACTSE